MNDQERMTDLLLTEKKMSTNYNLFASECIHPKLKDTFLDALKQGQTIQSDPALDKDRFYLAETEIGVIVYTTIIIDQK